MPTFEQLRTANAERCEEVFHPIESWSPTDWACAMAGEAGEACNMIKKLRRGDPEVNVDDIGKELADMVIYADLLATRLGIELGECVVGKFNEVSDRRGSTVRMPKESPAWAKILVHHDGSQVVAYRGSDNDEGEFVGLMFPLEGMMCSIKASYEDDAEKADYAFATVEDWASDQVDKIAKQFTGLVVPIDGEECGAEDDVDV